MYCDVTALRPEYVDAAIARQQYVKHVSAATDTHAIIEELFEAVFSLQGYIARSRYQAMRSEDYNRLRIGVCCNDL
jgi:hypothetical protein